MDEEIKDGLRELRVGQAAMSSAQHSMHLETTGRLTRLEEQVKRGHEDKQEISARLEKIESSEHVSVEWMQKVEKRTDANAVRIEEIAQQRGFLVGISVGVAWLLGVLAWLAMFLLGAVKAWLPTAGGK